MHAGVFRAENGDWLDRLFAIQSKQAILSVLLIPYINMESVQCRLTPHGFVHFHGQCGSILKTVVVGLQFRKQW